MRREGDERDLQQFGVVERSVDRCGSGQHGCAGCERRADGRLDAFVHKRDVDQFADLHVSVAARGREHLGGDIIDLRDRQRGWRDIGRVFGDRDQRRWQRLAGV